MKAGGGRTGSRGGLAWTVWLALLGMAQAGLLWLGHGLLAGPPMLHPSEIEAWIAARPATTVAFASLRSLALATGWYLLAVTVAGAVVRAASWPRGSQLVDALSPPFVKRLLSAGAGILTVSMTFGGPLVANASASTAPPAPPGTTIRRLTNAPPAAPVARPPAFPMPAPARAPTASAHAPPPPAAEPPPAQPSPNDGLQLMLWSVRSGDSLWSIAEATVAFCARRPADDSEVLTYWRTLIDANRARLANADDPDLIFPGQVFVLPRI